MTASRSLPRSNGEASIDTQPSTGIKLPIIAEEGDPVAEVDGLETSSFWVGADPGVNEYLVVGNFQDGGNYPVLGLRHHFFASFSPSQPPTPRSPCRSVWSTLRDSMFAR